MMTKALKRWLPPFAVMTVLSVWGWSASWLCGSGCGEGREMRGDSAVLGAGPGLMMGERS